MFEKIKNLFKNFTSNPEAESNERIQFNTLSKYDLGVGIIGPENRIDIDKNLLTKMYERISAGEFNIPAIGKVPEICVDGRTDQYGLRKIAPSAAGGTLSIVYGNDLGGADFRNTKNELQLTAETVAMLKKKGLAAGVHGDNHGTCGCGACAKAKDIYQHIVDHIDKMTALVNEYGIEVTDAEKEIIIQHAEHRLNQSDFFATDRATVLQTALEHGADYEKLVDAHNELGIVLNTRQGTTIDRASIRAVFGNQYDMFIVDVWSFDSAAKEVNQTGGSQNTTRIVKAMTLQNVATASVLGHASLPIIPV